MCSSDYRRRDIGIDRSSPIDGMAFGCGPHRLRPATAIFVSYITSYADSTIIDVYLTFLHRALRIDKNSHSGAAVSYSFRSGRRYRQMGIASCRERGGQYV